MPGDESKTLFGDAPPKKPIIVKTDTSGNVLPISQQHSIVDKKDRGKAFRQIVAAFIANIGTINTGLAFGFSAVVIPQLKAEDSIVPINEDQASWVASLSSATTPFGCILSGYLCDRIGRKKTLILTELPLILGWFLISMASDIKLIYAGRMLVGLGSGMVGAPARVYTSEVTQPHLRGMLSALASVGISFGVLFQYLLGSFLSWHILSGVSTIIPIMALTLMCCMPETPNFLVTQAKPEEAVKSLMKLRGSSYNVRREIDQLQNFANKSKWNAESKPTNKELIAALLSPATVKPFAILVIYFMMYQFSGVNTITFYAVEIFKDLGTGWNENTCTILLGVFRLVFTVIGCVALRRCGRRPLTFVSGIGCGVTMIGLGTYLCYKHEWDMADPPIPPTHTWIPVACIFIFTIACTLGFLIVPWVMIGELYPQKVRGIVGGMTTCAAHMFVFIVVKTYPLLTHVLTKHGTFIMYGCISFLGTVFFYLCLPETKGKSLQEIEEYFSGHTDSWKKKKPISTLDQNLNNANMPMLIVDKDIEKPQPC